MNKRNQISFLFLIMTCLGFSSGLPLALSGSTLQFWYNSAGMSLVALGWVNLIGLPYTLKFVWAPLMDRFVWPRLGRRRGWILLNQLALVVALSVMSFFAPSEFPYTLAVLALLVAFFSASQDIAIDAFRTDSLSQPNLGMGNAFYTAGYRIAMLVSGGIALILAGYFNFHLAYFLMALLMLLGIFVTLIAKEPPLSQPPTTLKDAIVLPFKSFVVRPYPLLLLAFILFYKLGDAFAFSVLGPFLARTQHLTLQELGAIYKTVGLFATLLGVFLGGAMMRYLKLYRSLLVFGVLQGVSSLFFILLLIYEKNYFLITVSIALENFASGMGTIAFISFLMNLCDHRYTATQFALLSSFSSVGRVYIGPIAGFIAEHFGWVNYFVIGCLLSFPGLFMLLFIKKKASHVFLPVREPVL